MQYPVLQLQVSGRGGMHQCEWPRLLSWWVISTLYCSYRSLEDELRIHVKDLVSYLDGIGVAEVTYHTHLLYLTRFYAMFNSKRNKDFLNLRVSAMSFYCRACETSLCCTLVVYETSVRVCMAELSWVGETQENFDKRYIFFTLNISMAVLLILCSSISWQMPLLFENWAIYRFTCCWVHLDRRFRKDLDTFQGVIGQLGDDFDDIHTLLKSLVQILLTAWNSLSQ